MTKLLISWLSNISILAYSLWLSAPKRYRKRSSSVNFLSHAMRNQNHSFNISEVPGNPCPFETRYEEPKPLI